MNSIYELYLFLPLKLLIATAPIEIDPILTALLKPISINMIESMIEPMLEHILSHMLALIPLIIKKKDDKVKPRE